MPFANLDELNSALDGVLTHDGATVTVNNAEALRGELMDRLVRTAVFSEDAETKGTARWLIKMAGQALGIFPASIQGLYEAMGRGEVDNITVPAVNVRGMAYDTARAFLRAAKDRKVGAFLFEIAKSEMGYTAQEPHEYAAVMMAAAIREGFTGPLFIQGDHFQINAKRFAEAPQEEIEGLKTLIDHALSAGFFNIDIDTSTLVTLDPEDLKDQQKDNYTLCAEFTRYIRDKEPEGVSVSVGGEIGEVGTHNSTVDEFKAFMAGYQECDFGKGPMISKMSVQSGTSHGGVPLADGSIADVALDFEVLRSIGDCARKDYGLCGAVQHGASTLPDELFDRFPGACASEIHLATGFQNLVMDHPALPEDFRNAFLAHVEETFGPEFKDKDTREQNIYKLRKKGWGSYKRQWWDLAEDVKGPIFKDLEDKFGFLQEQLKATDTVGLIEQHVKATPIAFSLETEIAACKPGFTPEKLDAKYESALAD